MARTPTPGKGRCTEKARSRTLALRRIPEHPLSSTAPRHRSGAQQRASPLRTRSCRGPQPHTRTQSFDTFASWRLHVSRGSIRQDVRQKFAEPLSIGRPGLLGKQRVLAPMPRGCQFFPGLARYDEVVVEGEVRHALRFTVARTQRAWCSQLDMTPRIRRTRSCLR